MPRIFLRVDLVPKGRIGPGKIALLEQIRLTGSISAAGRALGMSYRRAWLLVDELNRLFAAPVVTTQMGGSHGGGAALTTLGNEIVARFRALERAAEPLVAEHLGPLEDLAAEGCRRLAGHRVSDLADHHIRSLHDRIGRVADFQAELVHRLVDDGGGWAGARTCPGGPPSLKDQSCTLRRGPLRLLVLPALRLLST